MKSLLTALFIVALGFAMPPLAAGSNAGSFAGAARTFRLDNGMTLVLLPNHSVPMIAANIIIRAGSRDETWHTWGAAHFLEHLLFNGTASRTQEEIYAAFDSIGAYHNAHTGSHFIDFMLLVRAEDFKFGFAVLTDMVFNSTLPEAKFEKERGIVMEEIAQSKRRGTDPDQPVRELLFGGGPLAREVLGTVASIAALERDSVLAFYRRWFAPNNMSLFVTGDFNPDTMKSWLEEHLVQFPPREPAPRMKAAPPDWENLAATGIRIVPVAKQRRQLFIALPTPKPGEVDYPAMMLLREALEHRLEKALPPKVTGTASITTDPDLAYLNLSLTAPANGPGVQELDQLADGIIKNLAAAPPPAEEIRSIARRYRADEVFNSEKLHYYGLMNAADWALVSWHEFLSWPDRMAAITPQEFKSAAERLLVSQPRVKLGLEPPPTDNDESIATGPRQKHFIGPDNMTLIVRQDPSARVVAMHILARDRWMWDLKYGVGAVDLLHRLLVQDDLKASPPLSAQLDRTAAVLKTCDDASIPYDDYYTTPDFSFIRIETLPDDWRSGLKLVFDRMANPPASAEAFASAKESAQRARESNQRNPAAIGARALAAKIMTGSSFSREVYGDVQGLTISDLEELRQSYFHPSNLIVTIVAPDGIDSIAAFVQYQAGRLAKGRFAPPALSGEGISTDTDKLLTTPPDTLALGLAQGAVVLGAVINDITPEDEAALLIANAYLNERMGMVLREERGLAYSLGSSITLRRMDNAVKGWWVVSISTRQVNLEKARMGIEELLDELANHQFTGSEVARLASVMNGRMLMRDMARISQAFNMGTGAFYWDDPDRQSRFADALKAVTAENVERSVRRYLVPIERHRLIVN